MPHFSVAVFTKEKPEEITIFDALQPFHDYECDNDRDQFVIPVDIHEEYENFKECYEGDNEGFSSFEKYLENSLETNMKDESCDYVMIERRLHQYTNPNKKFDCYIFNQTYMDMLITKDDSKTSCCQIKDIDVDFQQNAIKEKALRHYNDMLKATDGVKKEWQSFKSLKGDFDTAIEFYKNQEAVKQIKKIFTNPFFDIDSLNCSLDEYLNKMPFAFQTDHVLIPWEYGIEGNDGWYDGEVYGSDWPEFYKKLYEENQDCYVTIVSCHA